MMSYQPVLKGKRSSLDKCQVPEMVRFRLSLSSLKYSIKWGGCPGFFEIVHVLLQIKYAPMQVELCLLPTEIIERIASYVDFASLYQLSRTNVRLRSVVIERLIKRASHTRIRLWIEQHDVAAHKPMDFVWSSFDATRQQAIFTCKPDTDILLFRCQDTSPPVIDGCTVIYREDSNDPLRMNSVAYRSSAVSVPLMSDHNVVEYRNISKCGERLWQLEYLTNIYHDRKSVEPIKMECSLDMLCDNTAPEESDAASSSSSTSSVCSTSSSPSTTSLSEFTVLKTRTHTMPQQNAVYSA